ncbi:MAG: M48 family metallopeptidase [Pseudomonadota bacterium]
MNFFEAQDRTRRMTRRLVVVYSLAVLIIIALVTAVVAAVFSQDIVTSSTGIGLGSLADNAYLLGGTALGTGGFIGLASAYKIARLSGGGARVALDLGATQLAADSDDLALRRLRNVVEEMAIASGMPVPDIFVLENESAINAFAAGYGTEDAAVAVTRGALDTLSRDELQGVIAHEFSHILNGDMRLNVRLMGILFGILAIGMIGRIILRSTRHGGRSSSSNRGGGAAAALGIGLALFIIGYAGVFAGRLIKAGVSRQREFLADASAVQFTRQTDGIAGALKKIGGYSAGSRIISADAEEISHMLFANGQRMLSGLLATHPPLEERIAALDPSFDATRREAPHPSRSVGDDDPNEAPIAGFAGERPVDAAAWLSESGQPGERHIEFAGRLRRSVPELLDAAAHSRDQSALLALALVLDADAPERSRQLALLGARLGDLRARRVAELYDEFASLGPHYRLPLLEMAFPALKKRPAAQVEFLIDLIEELILVDGHIELFEFAFARVLQHQLRDAQQPRRQLMGGRRLAGSTRLKKAARTLLAVFAYRGHDSEAEAARAYQVGLAALPLRSAEREAWAELDPPGNWVEQTDASLRALNGTDAASKRQLLGALVKSAASDGGLTVAEAELLRATAAVLQCPLPPLLAKENAT